MKQNSQRHSSLQRYVTNTESKSKPSLKNHNSSSLLLNSNKKSGSEVITGKMNF